MLGENSCRGTPSSIPNLEVKPVNAESTWREASWEDRNSPSTMSASLAQSVEHAAVNRSVVGSSPTGGAFYTWLHGQAVKTPPFHGGNRGSNPLGDATCWFVSESHLP